MQLKLYFPNFQFYPWYFQINALSSWRTMSSPVKTSHFSLWLFDLTKIEKPIMCYWCNQIFIRRSWSVLRWISSIILILSVSFGLCVRGLWIWIEEMGSNTCFFVKRRIVQMTLLKFQKLSGLSHRFIWCPYPNLPLFLLINFFHYSLWSRFFTFYSLSTRK